MFLPENEVMRINIFSFPGSFQNTTITNNSAGDTPRPLFGLS